MMGEIAAELTGRSVLKVLMWSSEVESNSCVESRGNVSADEFKKALTPISMFAATKLD